MGKEKFERNKIELSVFKKFETFFGDKKGKIQSVIPMATTTMPKDDWGVHESHCCSTHGCKYMDDQCPVALDIVDQKHDCEYCQKD